MNVPFSFIHAKIVNKIDYDRRPILETNSLIINLYAFILEMEYKKYWLTMIFFSKLLELQ